MPAPGATLVGQMRPRHGHRVDRAPRVALATVVAGSPPGLAIARARRRADRVQWRPQTVVPDLSDAVAWWQTDHWRGLGRDGRAGEQRAFRGRPGPRRQPLR